jgi:hypothetical protein
MYLLMTLFVRTSVSWHIAGNLIEADAADDMRRVCMCLHIEVRYKKYHGIDFFHDY